MTREFAFRIAGWILLALVLGFVGVALVDAARQIDWSRVRPVPGIIAIGAVLFTVSVALADLLVRLLYRDLGVRLKPGRGLVLYFVPMLGRYLPGKVASIAGHVIIARRYGIGLSVAAAAVGLLTVLGLMAAVAVGLVFLLVQPPAVLDPVLIRWLLAAGVIGLALACLPGFWIGALNAALRVFGREPLTTGLGYGAMLRLLGALAGHAVLTVAGYAAISLGCIGQPPAALPLIIGAICIANAIGFIAVFAPGGIGVREGILLLLLGPTLGAGPAALFTVVLRLVQTAVDALAGGIGLWLLRRDPGAEKPAPVVP